MPARLPAARNTDWSTWKPLCGQLRMFSTTSGSISGTMYYGRAQVEGKYRLPPGLVEPVEFGHFQELARRRAPPVLLRSAAPLVAPPTAAQ